MKKKSFMIVEKNHSRRALLNKIVALDKDIEVVGEFEHYNEAEQFLESRDVDFIFSYFDEEDYFDGCKFLALAGEEKGLKICVLLEDGTDFLRLLDMGVKDSFYYPNVRDAEDLKNFTYRLLKTIETRMKESDIPTCKDKVGESRGVLGRNTKIIAIGSSTGGTEAICSILTKLPSNIPGVVVVQHIPPKFSAMFADRLDKICSLRVKEAKTGDYVDRGCVYIAPGDKHMRIVKVGVKYKIECFDGEKVSGHCPSVDVLFDSVAKSAGKKAMGIILTGMGNDGARGLRNMKEAGARTIGQDASSCVVYGMPKVAFENGGVDTQVSLQKIAKHIMDLLNE